MLRELLLLVELEVMKFVAFLCLVYAVMLLAPHRMHFCCQNNVLISREKKKKGREKSICDTSSAMKDQM
jgi:hypothetical protein